MIHQIPHCRISELWSTFKLDLRQLGRTSLLLVCKAFEAYPIYFTLQTLSMVCVVSPPDFILFTYYHAPIHFCYTQIIFNVAAKAGRRGIMPEQKKKSAESLGRLNIDFTLNFFIISFKKIYILGIFQSMTFILFFLK